MCVVCRLSCAVCCYCLLVVVSCGLSDACYVVCVLRVGLRLLCVVCCMSVIECSLRWVVHCVLRVA